MSMTEATRSAQRAEPIINTKPLLFGVLALALLVVLLRSSEQAFGWTAGLDSFSPEFQIYWVRLLQGAIVLDVLGGAALTSTRSSGAFLAAWRATTIKDGAVVHERASMVPANDTEEA